MITLRRFLGWGVVGTNSLLFLSCASREPNVKNVDTTLEAKGSTGTQLVGLNEEGDAIVQEEKSLASEIRVSQHVNENLRMNVGTETFHLKECWKRRAQGTTGEMPEFSEYDDTALPAGTEEIGVVAGDIKVVRKEDAVARLKNERRRQEELRAHLSSVKRQREKCEFEAARDVAPKGTENEGP
ncbi:MAG: hypothetical protein IOD12_00135 [Silvanigrellales bacterium]|nr:hypothetical protein [Silvanigrellales bacterium]